MRVRPPATPTISSTQPMNHHLTKNGEIHCELLSVSLVALPPIPQHLWHECNLIASQRVIAGATDNFGIVTPEGHEMPYSVSRCCIGVEGWEIEGQVLY